MIISNLSLEEEFYSKPYLFSYSGLNKLLYAPKLFYNHYILKKREDKLEAHLVDGKLTHCLLLDEKSFHDQFVVSPESLPSKNTRKVIDKLHRRVSQNIYDMTRPLDDLQEGILEILDEVGLHSKVLDKKKRLSKVINDESKAYFLYLRLREDREIIDSKALERARRISGLVSNDPEVKNLLSAEKQENEKYLSSPIEGRPFGIKGIVDNLSLYPKDKRAIVNDFKNTAKSLDSFRETVENIKYWMQAAIYRRLVRALLGPDWTIEFNFIVIDGNEQVYPFSVSEETLLSWDIRLEDVLNKAQYHYEKRRYDKPYEFIVNKVTL